MTVYELEQRERETFYADIRQKLAQEHNWERQERNWEEQQRHWRWQRIYWSAVISIAGVALLARLVFGPLNP